jgi:predicted phosphodiesterase
MRIRKPSAAIYAALTLGTVALLAQDLTLPNKQGSLKFAVIGDSGTGDSNQYRTAKVLTAIREKFKYEFVIMVGDNMYGSQSASDYAKKFETPYKGILDQNIKFYAALGNHDQPNQANYKLFNMGGKRFYTFKPRDGVRFFALDSNYMDQEQLAWLEKELTASGSDWKIPFFHHPLYSSGGRHGSDQALRDQLEPLFVKHSVDVVFAGHDHFYERIKPQKGIQYFVTGGAGKVRKGDIQDEGLMAKGFDEGYHFMLVEIDGDQMHFQVISDLGKTIDSGTVLRNKNQSKTAPETTPAVQTVEKPIPAGAKPASGTEKPATGKPAPATKKP